VKIVNLYQAKTHLSSLIDRAAAGEEIIIARHDRPVAKLIAYHPAPAPRRLGLLAGRIRVSDDFDAPLPEDIQAAFEN